MSVNQTGGGGSRSHLNVNDIVAALHRAHISPRDGGESSEDDDDHEGGISVLSIEDTASNMSEPCFTASEGEDEEEEEEEEEEEAEAVGGEDTPTSPGLTPEPEEFSDEDWDEARGLKGSDVALKGEGEVKIGKDTKENKPIEHQTKTTTTTTTTTTNGEVSLTEKNPAIITGGKKGKKNRKKGKQAETNKTKAETAAADAKKPVSSTGKKRKPGKKERARQKRKQLNGEVSAKPTDDKPTTEEEKVNDLAKDNKGSKSVKKSEPAVKKPTADDDDATSTSPVDAYFYRYTSEGFAYKPTPNMNLAKCFRRLMKFRNIPGGTSDYDRERDSFERTLNQEFCSHFSEGDFSLDAWRRLCGFVGIEGAMEMSSITKCRKALEEGVFINIIDLIQVIKESSSGNNDGTMTVRHFRNVAELAKYCKNSKKYFKKGNAKHSVLKGLLRRVH